MVITTSLILLIFEFIFTFIPITNHNQTPLSSITWEVYYNRNFNSLGFRDVEINQKDTSSQKEKIFFIGDSFTAGFGLKKKKQRYSNLLEEQLYDKYTMFNFGKNGISTKEEFEILKQIEIQPDFIIWQYFFNDIGDICLDQLHEYPQLDLYKNAYPPLKWLIKNSYLLNYIYHKYYPLKGYVEYNDFFKNCAKSPQLQAAYYSDIKTIKEYCDARNIRLFFLIIPNSMQPSLSSYQDKMVEEILKELDIPFFNTTQSLLSLPLSERIINNQDVHLSKKSNQIVADSLQVYIEKW